ncbi:MAG TPA: AMP-binding protein [Methylovirgula sp.]
MTDYYDRYEKRAPRSREASLLRDLRGILNVAKSRAGALRLQLRDIDIDSLKTRGDLARIPVMRAAELEERQKQMPPFGGASATRPAALRRLLMAAPHRFQPQGHAKDWWSAARALFAAGIRKGDVVLNCFSYHFGADGHMIDSGCTALGCPVIPAGSDDVEKTLAVIEHYAPNAYCGPADFLKRLLEAAKDRYGIEAIRIAFFSAADLSTEAKSNLAIRNIKTYEAYATPELGVVAYETEARDALVVNEGLLVEIVRPGTGEPLPVGQRGEIVVTRLNADYPLLRFGTGTLSAIVPGQSPCGRTNMRLKHPVEPGEKSSLA